MIHLTVTPEFARFFQRLPDADAERVATTLDLIAEAGRALSPDRARRALLYYDGTHPSAGGWAPSPTSPPGHSCAELERRIETLHSYRIWQEEALRCLSSQPFSQRLSALGASDASEVLEAVQVLRERLSAALYSLPWQRRRPPSWHHARAELQATRDALREAFQNVMRAVGLDPAELPGAAGGLREVTIQELSPPVRILYGLSATADRAHLLVGDRLDRAAHADSVRLAERRFAEYCRSDDPEALEGLPW